MNTKCRTASGSHEELPDGPAPQRRAFLRALSGGAAIVGLPALLAACGGGGSDGPGADPDADPDTGGGGGGNGGGIDTAARVAAIRGVEDQCRALTRRKLEPIAFVDALAAHLRTQPIYAAVGFDHVGLCVWGEFADGRVHLIALNPPPRRASASAELAPLAVAAAAAPVEVPGSKAARVMQAFGPEFDTAEVVTDISAWLTDKGYTMSAITPHTAHVSALRGVRDDGYFYINAHGGALVPVLDPWSSQGMYSVQSSTLVTATQEEQPEMRADLDARRLTYFTAHNGETLLGLFDDVDTRYGITSNFVDAYWKFSADSVVVMNACSSARMDDGKWASDFVFACHKAGAAVYFGWNGTVTPVGAFRAPRYLTDRLVGANEFEPESPRQRPFAWDAVMGDLRKKQIDVDPGSASKFVALPKPAQATVPELAPSIHHVEVDEYKDRLKLHGRFGKTEGKVVVNRTEPKIIEWTPERIVCELKPTGTGSAGPVHVEVRGLKSNLRQLTEWTLKLDYTWKLLEAQGLKVAGLATIRLRADVGQTREAPGDVAVHPLRHTIATRESNLPMVASGAFPTPKCTLLWSGSPTYKAIPLPGEDDQLVAYLALDTNVRQGRLGLGIGSMVPDFTQYGCGDPTKFQAIFGTLDEQIMFPSPVDGSTDQIPLHALALAFGQDYRIAPGRFENLLVRLVWSEVVPEFAPTAKEGA